MKLYDVPRNTKIKVNLGFEGPPTELLFNHIDGMYSVCVMETGEIIHLMATTEVEVSE